MNAKQEILDALENGERYSFKHMPAHAEDEFSRIRAILPEACWSYPATSLREDQRPVLLSGISKPVDEAQAPVKLRICAGL